MRLLELHNLTKTFPVGRGGKRPWWTSILPGAVRAQPQGQPPELLHAVDEITLHIESGESVGLVGESGCGKSTLMRLISRLLDPTGGMIRFQGHDIGAIPAARFARTPERRLIQQVFQDATDSLNPRFTAAQAIADPIRRLTALRSVSIQERIAELAALVNLPAELLGRYPHQLSGGQKARVGIARALASTPQLLLLDEPTSALDVSVQAVVLKLLNDLRRQLGVSFLFVSHDLHVVRLMCDRVYVMYLGKIIESGPAWRVFERPLHPYTQALASAIPIISADRRRPRLRLVGEPMSPIDPDPSVCRLYGRCGKGKERCRMEMPALAPVEEGHSVACHYPEPLPLSGHEASVGS